MAVMLAACCGLATAGVARAAEYRVSACGSSAANQNHALAASVSDARLSAYTACPVDGNGNFVGVAALANVNVGTAPFFSLASQTFAAPGGTTIRRVHVKAEGRTWNGDWTSLLQASTDRFASSNWNLSGCGANVGSANGCVSALANVDQNYEIPGATGVRSVAGCANFGGCTTFSTGIWPYSRAYYFIHEFDVTLDDYSVPTVVATGGGLASQQWLRGTQSLIFNASDNSGIRRTRFWADDLGVIRDDVRGCDYTYAVPCGNVAGGEYSLDTTRLSDGVHHVAADGFDATDSNWANTYQSVFVDNHAPAEPGAPSVVGGEGWHTTNGFDVAWSNPASASPINRAFYELCKTDGSGCSTGSQSGSQIARLSGVQVPQPGDYTIRVWLADEAGNVSDSKTPALHLKFDNVVPAQAQPQHRNGWVNADDAERLDQQIDPQGSPPVSGIAGYAVTTDGSEPGATVSVPASAETAYVGRTELVDLAEGVTTVRARAVSGAGIPSAAVGSTAIYVDRTAPRLSVEGAPDPDRWTRFPVSLRAQAEDPELLSGMAGGPPDRGETAGGFIAYRMDGGLEQQTRGPERALGPDGRLGYAKTATFEAPPLSDGRHVLALQAFDVAGNGSPEKTVNFKLDQTPPEFVAFEPQQESDPRLLTVAATDRTSGLADGATIELRRITPTPGDWITLRTARESGSYYAHVDNATLPGGDYEFQAVVPDQAGNQAVGTGDRAGQRKIMHLTPTDVGPYSTLNSALGVPHSDGPDAQDARASVPTNLSVAAVRKVVVKKKCTLRNGRRRCARRHTSTRLVHELRIPYGKTATIRGSLATEGGLPISRTEITVLARRSSAGAGYTAEAAVRTDSSGKFTYRARAGSSRTLDLHYRGDEKYQHADDQVSLRVPAAATIKVNRHSARNGSRVRFTGKLRGRPYPPKGKVIDLEAFYRHKWRTFATPRVGRSGSWNHRYRFQATRGRVVYKFRVRVRATSDYPYEASYSKSTTVRVSG